MKKLLTLLTSLLLSCYSFGQLTIDNVFTTDAICNGTCDGTIDVIASGGVTPYTYDIGGTPQSSSNFSSLCAGTYTVTVTDASFATDVTTVTINEPAILLIDSIVTTVPANPPLCNGEMQIYASGGDTPYMYYWEECGNPSNNGFTATIPSVCAWDEFSATVTDPNGCFYGPTGCIIVDSCDVSFTLNTTDATIFGVCDGTADVTITGGTPPYTITYYNSSMTVIQTGSSTGITGLCAGTYYVEVTDGNACPGGGPGGPGLNMFTITEPPMLTASSGIDVYASCWGMCDATASISVSGGVPPYTYSWSGGCNSTMATNSCLCEGSSYSWTVTDANGATASGSLFIFTNPPYADMVWTDETCAGACDGTISFTNVSSVWDPFASYSYSIDDGINPPITQSTPDFFGVCPGTYLCYLWDGYCYYEQWVTIAGPTPLTASIVSAVDESCAGMCDGELIAQASGGTPPYTYVWDDPCLTPGPNSNALGCGGCAGTYTCTITDANGCTTTVVGTINSPSSFIASPIPMFFYNGYDVSCQGMCDGGIEVFTSGGTPPYSYSIDCGSNFQSSNQFFPLCEGSYCIVAMDANGCTEAFIMDLFAPPPLTASVLVTDVTCSVPCDGDVEVFVSGGVPPYSYSWDDPCSSSASSISGGGCGGACEGTYTCFITDANGCFITASGTVGSSGPTISSASTTPASGPGLCDGTATASVTGAAPPFSYEWFDCATGLPIGQTSANAIGLCAGSYYVEVTDANGCMITSGCIFDVVECNVTISSSIIDPSCMCDGMITLTASGGASPYTYSIDNCATLQPGNSFTGLCEGTYDICTIDAIGCFATSTEALSNTVSLTVTASVISSPSMAGLCDAEATGSVTGGSSPYTFSWLDCNTMTIISGPSSGTMISGLCDGDYALIAMDAMGCADTSACITITDPPCALTATWSSNPPTCEGGCDGDATVYPSGGLSPYTYFWNDPCASITQTSGCAGCAGVYECTITDAAGCSVTVTGITVIDPGPFAIQIVSQSGVTCDGLCDGTAVVTTTGGITPIGPSTWSNGEVGPTADSLCSGSNSVTAVDANGCVANLSITISSPAPLNGLAIFGDNPSFPGACDGEASVMASGGTTPYAFEWVDCPYTGSFGTGDSIATLCAGDFAAVVTDANGCVDTSNCITLNEPPATVHETDDPFGMALYPNPTNGLLNITLTMPDDDLNLQITDVLGNLIHADRLIGKGETTIVINLNELNIEQGIYFLTLYDQDSEISTKILYSK